MSSTGSPRPRSQPLVGDHPGSGRAWVGELREGGWFTRPRPLPPPTAYGALGSLACRCGPQGYIVGLSPKSGAQPPITWESPWPDSPP